MILKELKTAKEQIDSCPADRTELKAEYQARYDVISEYAPKLLSAEEVKELLKGFSKQFLESHEEFQNPRDEYTLSHVSNADMVVEELVSTF